MSKTKVFIGLCLSFSAGILLASKFAFDLLYVYAVCGIAVMAVAFSLLMSHPAKAAARLCGLFLFFACAGFLRFEQTIEANQYQEFFDQKVRWEGYVMEDPDVRADKQLIAIKPKGNQQRILITTTKGQEFFYGDWIVFEGKVKQPKAFEEFDYPGYLERFSVYATVSYPKILILRSDQGNPVKTLLLKTKRGFVERLRKFLPEPQNSLALGILIGARRGLPQDVIENFNSTGTSHIIAISGYNIAVIVAALSILAWIVGRRASFWLSLFIILGFVVIAGASASVVRAAVMGILLLMAFNIGRLYSVMPALLFAAAVMLYINPKILYWDVGFQLSFAATLGIVLLMPLVEKLTSNWPKVFGLKSIFFVTLSATVSTLPLVLWYFGRLSLVSLLANLLILPVVPLAMLFGFLTVLPFVAPGFALLAGWLLSYILWVTKKLSVWPFASLSVDIGQGILILLIIALVFVYFILRYFADRKSTA